jgi:hypothetical protein
MYEYIRYEHIDLPTIHRRSKIPHQAEIDAENEAVKQVNDFLGVELWSDRALNEFTGAPKRYQRAVPWNEALDGTMFYL